MAEQMLCMVTNFVLLFILICIFVSERLCRDLERQFCSHCGNHTMVKITRFIFIFKNITQVRVSVSVDSQGKVHQWFSHRAVYNLRGTRYPIPAVIALFYCLMLCL